MIRYGCLFTRDGVAVGLVRPHRDRKAAVEEAVAVAVAVAEGQSEADVRTWLLNDEVAPWSWEVAQHAEGDDPTMKELLHDACAVQIIRIASDPPVEDVESRMRVAEAPSLRAEPELSERAQDTLSRHGLSP